MPTAQFFNQGARVVLSIVLAWFLTTTEFGLVAVAMVVMLLTDRLADLGTGQAVIQRPHLDDRLADAIFALNTAIGLGLALIIFVFAEPLTFFAGGSDADDAVGLIRFLALAVMIKTLGVVQFALLRRRMQFRKAALTLIANGTVYSVVAIVLAVRGAGAWAMVIGSTAGHLASVTLAQIWSGWTPRWRFDWESIRNVSGFSLSLTATNLFTTRPRTLTVRSSPMDSVCLRSAFTHSAHASCAPRSSQ